MSKEVCKEREEKAVKENSKDELVKEDDGMRKSINTGRTMKRRRTRKKKED